MRNTSSRLTAGPPNSPLPKRSWAGLAADPPGSDSAAGTVPNGVGGSSLACLARTAPHRFSVGPEVFSVGPELFSVGPDTDVVDAVPERVLVRADGRREVRR
ncbi:hypothetical protein [Streptomyces sp. NPDC088736]|uniref:hypothetical protein n=1 Tax=Streptomyces sp. NPDC088736 TaxID=3365881 RepID=UPI003818F29D